MPKAWLEIEEDWCKACEICIKACKPGILQLAEHFNPRGYHPVEIVDPEKCTGCMACALVCPDVVIEVYRQEKAKAKRQAEVPDAPERVVQRK